MHSFSSDSVVFCYHVYLAVGHEAVLRLRTGAGAGTVKVHMSAMDSRNDVVKHDFPACCLNNGCIKSN